MSFAWFWVGDFTFLCSVFGLVGSVFVGFFSFSSGGCWFWSFFGCFVALFFT